MKIKKDLLIIGGGSAGLSAAIEAKKNGVNDILIIEKDDCLGGILNQCIHNGFGLTLFKKELTGPEFASILIDKIKELKIEFWLNTTLLDVSKTKIATVSNANGVFEIEAKAIIITTGCYERNAGHIALPGKRLAGVISAGTAQKYLNIYGCLPGKRVVILGSGDIGLIMARRLKMEGAEVVCVAELMPYSNGLNRNIVQCLEDFNIPLYLSTTVSDVIGKERVEKVVLSKVDKNFNIASIPFKEIECDTLLLSVGLIPYLGSFKNLDLIMGRNKGPEVDQFNQTSIPGVFICGNCLHVHDVVDFVCEESFLSGYSASLFLKGYLNNQNKEKHYIIFDKHISYVVPNFLVDNNINDVYFKFRVNKPIKNCFIQIYNNKNLIFKVKKIALIPSEMVMIKIKKHLIFVDGIKPNIEIKIFEEIE